MSNRLTRIPALAAAFAVLISCSAEIIEPIGAEANGLRFIASVATRTAPLDRVTPELFVANTRSEPFDFAYSTCPLFATVSLRVYTVDGRLVWDADAAHRGIICTLQREGRVILPGEFTRFDRSFDVVTILGDSLPPGQYELRVPVRVTHPALPKELSVGRVELQ